MQVKTDFDMVMFLAECELLTIANLYPNTSEEFARHKSVALTALQWIIAKHPEVRKESKDYGGRVRDVIENFNLDIQAWVERLAPPKVEVGMREPKKPRKPRAKKVVGIPEKPVKKPRAKKKTAA